MHFSFIESLTPAVRLALIPKAMGSGNYITELKAETVPEVQTLVKYHP